MVKVLMLASIWREKGQLSGFKMGNDKFIIVWLQKYQTNQ